jgi:hypothetical protein
VRPIDDIASHPAPAAARQRRVRLLGAGALVAILFATSGVDDSTTSAAPPPVTAGPTVGSASLHPSALYANTAPGVVDIIARGSTTVHG